MRNRSPHKRHLTPDEARSAIYIDFEGPKTGGPVLLGALYNSSKYESKQRWVFRQYILDPALAGYECAYEDDRLVESLVSSVLIGKAMHEVLGLTRKLDRKLVSFSHHELRMIEIANLTSDDEQGFRDRYIDGKATGAAWLRAVHPEAVPDKRIDGKRFSLALFLPLLGLAYPEGYGASEVSGWIKQSRDAIKKRGSWDDLLPSQQERWRKVLAHNAFDCFALRDLAMKAAAELAGTRGQRVEPSAP